MSRMERKTAQPVGEALRAWLKAYHLTPGLNTQRVFAAWDQASGAAPYTVRRYYRDGILYITLNSSVIRSQLNIQRQFLLEKMNAILAGDELFTRDEPLVGFVKELRLK